MRPGSSAAPIGYLLRKRNVRARIRFIGEDFDKSANTKFIKKTFPVTMFATKITYTKLVIQKRQEA